MNSNMTTFWRFLNEHKVEIPIIQRDYAQGRQGKEELRKTFLKDLKHSLDSRNPLKLDFVYGVAERGAVNPLDGQQRLTTLWLLHWYIAYMSGKIDENVSKTFKRFSYETRISSREFCGRLSSFGNPFPDGKGIVAHIQNQTWFRSSWHHDPTIQSMLRMLGGSEYGALDGIEGVFNACYDGECIECRLEQCPVSQVNCDSYDEYWNQLTDNECPIVFHYLDVHGIGQTDDLYIKMNARGKPLTSFENFKADLVDYIDKKVKSQGVSSAWGTLNDPTKGMPIKMDVDWMGIFWKNRSLDYAVDEIYFAFLTRYFFNACALQLEDASNLQKDDSPIFDFLYGRNASSDGENEKIAYLGFDDIFKKVLDSDNALLTHLYDTLDNYSRFCDDLGKDAETYFEAPWNEGKENKFKFVPRYVNNELLFDFAGNRIRKIDRITQPHRVMFYAVCKFFEQGWNTEECQKEKVALKDWMRVVWNIVENANIDTIPRLVRCLNLIDKLAEWSHNVLEEMSNEHFSLKFDFAKNQINEEIEKARKILEDRNKWEKLIREAERSNVFKGAIRCLYKGAGKGKIDWDNFQTRWKNAQCYFNSLDDSRMYHYLRWLVANCTTSEELKGIVYDVCMDTWKKNLLNDGLCITVDRFLMAPMPDVIELRDGFENDERYKNARADLCSPAFLEGLSYNGYHVNGCMLREAYGQLALFPSNAKSEQKKYMVANKRNALLAALGTYARTWQKLSGCNYYWGWDIYFEYNGHKFQWHRDDKVYLLDEKDQYIKDTEGMCLCFNTKEIDCIEQLKKKLNELAK